MYELLSSVFFLGSPSLEGKLLGYDEIGFAGAPLVSLFSLPFCWPILAPTIPYYRPTTLVVVPALCACPRVLHLPQKRFYSVPVSLTVSPLPTMLWDNVSMRLRDINRPTARGQGDDSEDRANVCKCTTVCTIVTQEWEWQSITVNPYYAKHTLYSYCLLFQTRTVGTKRTK